MVLGSPKRKTAGGALSMRNLALLWQIYSRCFSLQIHFLQRGHRCCGGRAMSWRMAWRTAGNVGRGGGRVAGSRRLLNAETAVVGRERKRRYRQRLRKPLGGPL